MPKSCAAYNCTNRYSSKNKELTFHRFPFSKPDLLIQWMNNVGRAEFKPNQHTVICSEHFKTDCFNTWGNRKNLKHNAVPTIFRYSGTMKVFVATPSGGEEHPLQAIPEKASASEGSADHTYAATNLGMMKKRLFSALEKNEKLRKQLKVKQEEMRRMVKKWQAVKDELEDLRAKSLSAASKLNLAEITQLQHCIN
ncbi:THAP domain-containing protein 3 isoform X3 [Heterodontus francisci]|uniref:THAP domain-containing protein 3 isoform X3 n=1 Tax=Heterodontus francisci TaxID=7792 RepID=UPI00355C8D86